MKTVFLATCFLVTFKLGFSQDQVLDRIEYSFERVFHTTAFPCHWKLQRTPKIVGIAYPNGSPLFIRDDSARFEIEFYNTKTLPFYSANQTSHETSKAFYTWELNQLKNQKAIVLTKADVEELDPFVIMKIKTKHSETYRLIVTANNVTYSIKLEANGQSIAKQLEDLKLLGSLNINN